MNLREKCEREFEIIKNQQEKDFKYRHGECDRKRAWALT